MGITPAGGSDGGSGTAGGRDLRLPAPEHGCTVHCDHTNCGPVSGRGAETRAKGIQLVVATGSGGCGRDTYGGLGGGTDVWGGGDGQDRNRDGLNWWEDNVENINLGIEPNAPLVSVTGLEHHHPIMSMLGDPGGRLEIYIYI